MNNGKSAEDMQKFLDFTGLSKKVLQLANRGESRAEFFREASDMILEFSRQDRTELFVRDLDICYHSVRSRENGFVFDILHKNGTENPHREDWPICREIIYGKSEPSPQIVINRSSSGAEISSTLILPFYVAEESPGVLTLTGTGRFNSDDVIFYQGLAQTLGIAIANRRAQADLRERIKEIGCMYGICQLFNLPDLPLSSILRRIAGLLPPAMQYPELASGLVALDDITSKSPGFCDRGPKLTSEIIIDGITRGTVQVSYRDEKSAEPLLFLREEVSLLETVARNIALIVQKKQAQEEKQRLQAQLQHADRLATIGQLAAGVAHELNEPLANILGFTQLAQKETDIPPQVAKDLDKVVNASLHAREIVRKLLIFSRQMPPRKIKVRINPLIEDVISFFQARFIKDRIEPVLTLDPDLPPITADISQIRQVLVNLIVNGMQAMNNGGALSIATGLTDEGIKIEIQDTGTGMEKEILEKIFIPFFTTKKVGQGTGLGLPVVHGIISSHGGEIRAESEPGRGSTFVITLPVNQTEEKGGSGNDISGPHRGNPADS